MSMAIKTQVVQYDPENMECMELIKRFIDQDAFLRLLAKHSEIINWWSHYFFAPGLTAHDLYQEGCMGLFIAMRKYKVDRGSSFKSYAVLHIKGKIINAVKVATRKKQNILSSSFSLEALERQESLLSGYDRFQYKGPSPEDIVILKEENRIEEVHKFITTLSKLEQKVLAGSYSDLSYKEIAGILNLPEKSVDNAKTRIRKKAVDFLRNRNTI